jgi:ABC-type nitrate/sulfonate/bicarbonate transport system substrate-binding protein
MRAAQRVATAVAGLLAASVLAACGSSSDPAEAGTMSLKVGYFPLVHTASVVNAERAGLFEREGLDVELVQTAGGAQAIPSLIAGENHITYTNYTSAILAAQKGLPIRIVAGTDVGAEDHGVVVNADSPLRSAKDLAGKRVAVNNLQNIGSVAVSAILEAQGADPESVEFVELPYPDMRAALDRGDVDAIWQVEPFQAGALAGGDRVLFQLFSGPVAGMPVAGWVTTEKFAKENPEALAAFRKALAASAEQLQGNRERLVELVPTYSKVPAATLEKVAMPVWDAEPNRAQLAKVAGLMEEYGIIAKPFDVDTIILGAS